MEDGVALFVEDFEFEALAPDLGSGEVRLDKWHSWFEVTELFSLSPSHKRLHASDRSEQPGSTIVEHHGMQHQRLW